MITRHPLRYGYPWATVALGPLLLAQGAHVRRVTPRLPEAAGARSGVFGQGRPLRVLILGDSAAAGVGVNHQDEALSGQLLTALAQDFHLLWRLEAKSGYTTPDIIRHLNALPACAFDVAVISIGVNDVTRACAAREWLSWQSELHALLRSRFSVQQILCSALPPMHRFPALPQPLRWWLGSRTRHLNEELGRYTRQQGYELIAFDDDGPTDIMASDGFHPGAPIYQRWAQALATTIRARWHTTPI